MKILNWAAVSVLSIPLLGACGNPKSGQATSALKGDSDDESVDTKEKSVDTKEKSVFNLAEYFKDSPFTTQLAPFSQTGDVIFGDMKKIGIRTNVKVDTSGSSKITGSSRNIVGQYYLNGAVYPDGVQIGGRTIKIEEINHEYSIVDIEAKAGFDIRGIEGHVRLFGDDKFEFSNKASYEQSFTRELKVKYPVMIGLEAKAGIGAEISFHAEVFVRQDDAISLRFQPKVAVNTSLSAEANALRLVSAQIKGTLTLMETLLSTNASVGYLPKYNFSYGDISLDSTSIKALDGKVVVIAKAGLDSLLPDSFQAIWEKVSDFTGIELGYTWQHTVWDPKPLWVGKIPARGIIFMSDITRYPAAQCSQINDQLLISFDTMEKEKENASGLDKSIAQSAQSNIAKTINALSTCGFE